MSRNIDIALKAAELQLSREMTSKLNSRMAKIMSELGHIDSLRRKVLTLVISENYEKAADEVRAFIESKKDFPVLISRTERHVSFAIDLIHAVKGKRGFPGLSSLPMSKQQDLFDRAIEHFDELKGVLHAIERAEREVKLDDIKSTVWVIKAAVWCSVVLLIIGFVMELSRGVLPTAFNLIDSYFGDLTNYLFDKMGI